MDAFRSREEALAARNAELETQVAAERARADAAEKALGQDKAFEGATDVHVGLARGLLWVSFVGYLGLVLISFPAYIAIAHDEADNPYSSFYGLGIDPTLIGVGMALVVVTFFAPVGIGAITGAIGLRRGKRWGYVAAVLAFGVLSVGCPLVGAYGLWALLRERVRHVFYPPLPIQAVAYAGGFGPHGPPAPQGWQGPQGG
jgi:MFS family permease